MTSQFMDSDQRLQEHKLLAEFIPPQAGRRRRD